MAKKYVLVEVGGETCPLRGLNFCGVARVYCGDKDKCCVGHTAKEIIGRRAKAIEKDLIDGVSAIVGENVSDARVEEASKDLAAATLEADLDKPK
jgi:hypothetical protein